MASEATLDRLFAEFDSPPDSIRAVVGLLEEQASPAFLARYWRWSIGSLTEDRVQGIAERLHTLEELEQRKVSIRQQAEERGSWTEELAATVGDSVDQDLIDDLYQSMRPRRRGPAMQMEEKGLGPLAMAIQHRQLGEQSLQDVAQQYVSEENGLPSVEAVLEGALLILSDKISHDSKTRARCRDELRRGVLKAKAVDPTKGAARYQDFFDFAEPIQRIPTGRMLALRRAEREGILKLQLTLTEDRHRAILRELHSSDIAAGSPLQQYYDVVFDHAWHSLQEICGRDVRRRIKEKADREAVRTYSRNLRSQLLAPPLGHKKVLALRASGKGSWGVLLAEDGSVAQYKTLPLQTDEQKSGALDWLVELIQTEQPEAIAVPHGRRQGATEKVVAKLRERLEKIPMVVPVDEAASTIFASGNAGKKAMPGIEVGVRTTISLGRRLQDPLLELVRMDVRALGLGHVDDVHQGMLHRELAHAVSSCLAAVGIDLNTCDKSLLEQLPGLGSEQAQALLEARRKSGGFKTRAELAAIEKLGATTVRNIAGFLRVYGGDEALDATPLHPDDYPIVRAIAEQRGVAPTELFGANLRDVDAGALANEATSKDRVIGVLQQLRHAGDDARGELVATDNEGLNSFADLHADRELRGRVTSLTEFGAFVDMGIGQDGLVHVSQIPAQRLRDPNQTLRTGEVVTVWVLNVDNEKRKIALSMMKPRHLQEGRLPTIGERMALQQGRRPRRQGEGDGGGDQRPRRGAPARSGPGGPGRSGPGRSGPGRSGPGRSGPGRSGPGDRGGRDRDHGYGGGGRDRGGRDHGPREQRVYTVEPGHELGIQRTKKGELTSLSNLGALFGGGDQTATPPPAKAEPQPQPQPRQPQPGPKPEPRSEPPTPPAPVTPPPAEPKSDSEGNETK